MRRGFITTRVVLSLTVMAVLELTGCLSPLALHRAVIEYDKTVGQIEGEMLLLNIARAKNGYPIHFTGVSNVAATFDFRTSGGLGGQLFEGGGTEFFRNTFLFNWNASVSENPTVSIVPVQGEEFTKRIMTPLDEAKFEFLYRQGVEPAIVLRLMSHGILVQEYGRWQQYLNMPHREFEYMEFRRRILHLSALTLARQLHVGPILYEERWPLPVDHPLTAQSLGKGYRWVQLSPRELPVLSRPMVGRIVVTNYDVGALSNEERRLLNERANEYQHEFILVDIRSSHPGGDYPWSGWIQLRSFNSIIKFLARTIRDEPEFQVEPDGRTGTVLRNPAKVLEIREAKIFQPNALFAVRFAGAVYSITKEPADANGLVPWNHEGFGILYHLYQMTVTDVSRMPTLPITIAK